MRTAFICALALVSGCGGCESCLGTAAVEDAATTTTSPPATVARPDAALDASGTEAAARDAEPEAAAPAAILRDGGPLLRPKAPMPLGAFSACGVYDGPLCEKVCPKGACRQECEGVACLLTCAGGYCSQLCGATATCKMTCTGGHCVQACTKAEGCIKECAGGSCE